MRRIPMIRKRAVGMGHSVLGEGADPDGTIDYRSRDRLRS